MRMGATQGKKLQEEEEITKPAFNAYFSPGRERAYLGPPLEYHFVDMQLTVRPQVDGFSRTPSLSSEDEGHYALLEQPYSRGFRLQHFTKIPGGLQRTGHLGSSVLIDFQGVFCRQQSDCQSPGCVELRVEKAWLQTSRMPGGLWSRCLQHTINTSCVDDSLRRAAQSGERLLCVGSTGQEDCRLATANTGGPATSVMRVDLFFEMTSQLTCEQFTYSLALVPCKLSYRSQVMFRPVPILLCDWKATFTHHLSMGWRLVDIYIDIPTVSQFCDPKSQDFSPCSLNTVWFLEKPVSRLDDSRPRYEGKVIEHGVKVKSQAMGSSAVVGWEKVVRDMGKRGWELACVLETHDMESAGLSELILKSLLFFQRPLPHTHSSPSRKGYYSPAMTGSRASLSD